MPPLKSRPGKCLVLGVRPRTTGCGAFRVRELSSRETWRTHGLRTPKMQPSPMECCGDAAAFESAGLHPAPCEGVLCTRHYSPTSPSRQGAAARLRTPRGATLEETEDVEGIPGEGSHARFRDISVRSRQPPATTLLGTRDGPTRLIIGHPHSCVATPATSRRRRHRTRPTRLTASPTPHVTNKPITSPGLRSACGSRK